MPINKLEHLFEWGKNTFSDHPSNHILFNFDSPEVKKIYLSTFLRLANHFQKCDIRTAVALTIGEIKELIQLGWVVVDFTSSSSKIFDFVKDKSIADVKYISNKIEKEVLKALPETDFIGFQRHIVEQADLYHVDTYSLGSSSLGMIKNRHTELEPVFRTVQAVSFDLSAGRSSEWPGLNICLPTGLSVEEICQIFRYSGSSYQIEYFGLNDLHPEVWQNEDCVTSIAIACWYFIEGVDSRVFKNDYAISGFQEFVLNVKDIEESLVFAINTDDGKWWVRVEDSEKLIPCSKEDYERASMGFLSDRLFRKLFT